MNYYYYAYSYRDARRPQTLILSLTQCIISSTGDGHAYKSRILTVVDIPNVYSAYPLRNSDTFNDFQRALPTTCRPLVSHRIENASQPIAFSGHPLQDGNMAGCEWVIVGDFSTDAIATEQGPFSRAAKVDNAKRVRSSIAKAIKSCSKIVQSEIKIYGPDPTTIGNFRHACAVMGLLDISLLPTWLSSNINLDTINDDIIPFSEFVRAMSVPTKEELASANIPSFPPLSVVVVTYPADDNSNPRYETKWLCNYTQGVDLRLLPSSLEEARQIPSPPSTPPADRVDLVVVVHPAGIHHGFSPEQVRNVEPSKGLQRISTYVAANRNVISKLRAAPPLPPYGCSVIVDSRVYDTWDKVLGYLQFAIFNAKISGLPWEGMSLAPDALAGTTAALCENAALIVLYKRNYHILPGMDIDDPFRSPTPCYTGSYGAGRSDLFTQPGVYGPGAQVDIAAYYPSIIRELQCCYTNAKFWPKVNPINGVDIVTISPDDELDRATRITQDAKGMAESRASMYTQGSQHPLPEFLGCLFELRKRTKKSHERLSDALKLIANSIYGNWGAKNARLSGRPLAVTIGTSGKLWISELADQVVAIGGDDAIHVDMIITDSLMVRWTGAPSAIDRDFPDILKQFRSYIQKRFKFIDTSPPLFYKSALIHAKGCYALLAVNNGIPDVHVRGFIQRDMCPFVANILRDIIASVLLARAKSHDNILPTVMFDYLTATHVPHLEVHSNEPSVITTQRTAADSTSSWDDILSPYAICITEANANRHKLRAIDQTCLRAASTTLGSYKGVVVIATRRVHHHADESLTLGLDFDDSTMDVDDANAYRHIDDTDSALCLIPVAKWAFYSPRYRLAWKEWYLNKSIVPVFVHKIVAHLSPNQSEVTDFIKSTGLEIAISSSHIPKARIDARPTHSVVSATEFSELSPSTGVVVSATCRQCNTPVRVDSAWRTRSGFAPDLSNAASSCSIEAIQCGNCGSLLGTSNEPPIVAVSSDTEPQTMAQHRERLLHMIIDYERLRIESTSTPPVLSSAGRYETAIMERMKEDMQNNPYDVFAW